MVRVAGTDPGTSSLDLLILNNGSVEDQCRFSPPELQADPASPARWLQQRGPFDLIAGPSGYGLPLISSQDCTDRELALMTLVRPDERDRAQGVRHFSAVVRALCATPLPLVFLPGVIHLPTVPSHRKINRIDLGTADKLCVVALALAQRAAEQGGDFAAGRFCVVELGTAFTGCVVVDGGRVVDGLGGTCGPVGWRAAGAWDGETAYLLSPLSKDDLFTGGVQSQPDAEEARALYRESLRKSVGALQTVTPFTDILLSGRLLEIEPACTAAVLGDLSALGRVAPVRALAGAWVKQAAQGAALVADGLAGGGHQALVAALALRQARGSVLDWLRHPRAGPLRAAFGLDPVPS